MASVEERALARPAPAVLALSTELSARKRHHAPPSPSPPEALLLCPGRGRGMGVGGPLEACETQRGMRLDDECDCALAWTRAAMSKASSQGHPRARRCGESCTSHSWGRSPGVAEHSGTQLGAFARVIAASALV